MVSQECLSRCREKLLDWRTDAEEEIKKLGGKLNSVQRKDFEPESTQFFQELEKRGVLYSAKFAELRKINVRISEIEKFSFFGTCPKCGEDMEEEVLEKNPLRVLCVGCQKAENKNKRR